MIELLDYFFPKHCYFCGKTVRYICNECIESYVEINWEHRCFKCGKVSYKDLAHKECVQDSYLDGLIFFTIYNKKIQEIIRDIKYNLYYDVARELGDIMSNYLKTYKLAKGSVLVDVPLSTYKKRYRGFNQSEILAKRISQKNGIEYKSILTRTRNTETQVGKSIEDRENNLRDVFRLKSFEKIDNVILVDDVYTSGATLNECAKEIKLVNPEANVVGFVFAKSRL